jgi:nucleoside-diphosphate-sugar epimerase
MSKLLFGCGYLGRRVVRRWLEHGDEAFGVTRRAGSLAELAQLGLREVVADVTDPATLGRLPRADCVVYAVGYDRSPGRSIHAVYAGGVRNVLDALPAPPRCFVYVSTTGVYPDAAGAWIDESTPTDPQREGGRASLAAEEVLRASPVAPQAVILRMAGLYGPGRVPFLERLRAGQSIPAAEEGWLNLIHIDDAAAAIVAAERWMLARGPAGPRALNVCDGRPVRRAAYYAEVARLMGGPAPRFEAPDPASHRVARAATSRRISNAELLRELQFTLLYPSYREGLRATVGCSCREQL